MKQCKQTVASQGGSKIWGPQGKFSSVVQGYILTTSYRRVDWWMTNLATLRQCMGSEALPPEKKLRFDVQICRFRCILTDDWVHLEKGCRFCANTTGDRAGQWTLPRAIWAEIIQLSSVSQLLHSQAPHLVATSDQRCCYTAARPQGHCSVLQWERVGLPYRSGLNNNVCFINRTQRIIKHQFQ